MARQSGPLAFCLLVPRLGIEGRIMITVNERGERLCDYYKGCDVWFIPPKVTTRHCPEHRDKKTSRHSARRDHHAEAWETSHLVQWAGRVFDEVTPANDGTLSFEPRDYSSTSLPGLPRFISVDGEGIGRGKDHRYVLLGVGQEQREWPDGVRDITEIFSFLYDQFLANPDAVFAGFFLGYDFNMWLRLLPRERAWRLLTEKGRASRRRKTVTAQKLGPFPVEYQGWEFDILGMKRFKLRRKGAGKFMFINDAGPFYQTSLLTAIDPKSWREPIVSPDEYALIKQGKERRDSATLDDDMRMYNRLENEILARLIDRLADGLSRADVRLKKQQWFGPGQAAQAWMHRIGTLEKTTEAVRDLAKRKLGPVAANEGSDVKQAETFYDAIQASYYGGWFEIPVHGHVPGLTYEYDLNSAYPAIASKLPCMCGKWVMGKGTPAGKLTHQWITGQAKTLRDRKLRLCHVRVQGRDKHLGPLPYRHPDGRILRPRYTFGWYWQHEIDAAKRAGLISEITYYEWLEYTPCHHEPPLRQLEGLYQSRLRIGKDTPAGKAFKLVYNSVYGKFAQSVGEPAYGNSAYASLIVSGCRTRILDAIATHPDKSAAVAMVATDGLYFLSPHPGIDAERSAYLKANPRDKDDERLGHWSRSEKKNLTLFKPGVYWDDKAREAIAKGDAPRFKSRGINAADFSKSIARVDKQFSGWTDNPAGDYVWPAVSFRARFTQVSVLQGLQWTQGLDDAKQNAAYRKVAGLIQEGKVLTQDSNPDVKRNVSAIKYDSKYRIYRSEPHAGSYLWPESTPYDKSFGLEDDTEGFSGYATPDGPAMMQFRQALGVG